MVGLYDTEGVLRFVGSSIEACFDYAALFEIPLLPCSLQALPEPGTLMIRAAQRRGGRSS